MINNRKLSIHSAAAECGMSGRINVKSKNMEMVKPERLKMTAIGYR
jgi:hypothetical protein